MHKARPPDYPSDDHEILAIHFVQLTALWRLFLIETNLPHEIIAQRILILIGQRFDKLASKSEQHTEPARCSPLTTRSLEWRRCILFIPALQILGENHRRSSDRVSLFPIV